MDGKRNGYRLEFDYDDKLIFIGYYFNDKKWSGKIYDINGKSIYYIINGKEIIEEHFQLGFFDSKLEGKFIKGKINGKGKE